MCIVLVLYIYSHAIHVYILATLIYAGIIIFILTNKIYNYMYNKNSNWCSYI